MNEITPEGYDIPLSISSEHGRLHGRLALQPGGHGIVVLAHAAVALDERDNELARHIRRVGLSTLSVDLLARQEEHFSDVHNNVPLLARRLLDFLALIKNQMLLGELQQQPLGLCAANTTSPVAVRVAALRDHDIRAVVCRGGLIDLAGMTYLRSLSSPLLLLVEETDDLHVISNRRALQKTTCRNELVVIPEIGIDYAVSKGFEIAADKTSQWFLKCFADVSGKLP